MGTGIATTELGEFIRSATLCDTHEHLAKEDVFLESPPDVLLDLFDNYVTADLVVAGAKPAVMKRLMDPTDRDLAARFAGVREVWECCRHTGYGEAVRRIARSVFGMDEITPEALGPAQERSEALRRPGMRLELLRAAGLDHVQTDDFCWPCLPDLSGPDFFLYDLSWLGFCSGELDFPGMLQETGVEVRDLETLREAMAGLFAKYGPCAIAVKAQHAYSRTLRWEEREDADAARLLETARGGTALSPDEKLVLGDWCWARGAELAAEHHLPFKIHTGYYAGHSRMPVDRIRAGNLCGLLTRYPQTRFVLMHIAYPYSEELVALAKHYPNVWVDLCWAWSINPHAAGELVRSFIHAVPANKLLGFGGDTRWAWASAAYTDQAREGLARALSAEVLDGLMNEREALALAGRFMQGNQRDCFDLEGTRAAIREKVNGRS